MIRIVDGRGTGKTSRLLLLAKEYGGVVICSNPHAMKVKAESYGLTNIPCYSYDEYWSSSTDLMYNQDIPIFVDEIDEFLKHWDANIQGYTASIE
jgi:hypothetical protein